MNAPVLPGGGSPARPRVDGSPLVSSLFRVLLPACSAAVVVAVTVFRLNAVRDATFPGHADKSFYFGVAQNLSSGRGPNVDYVWHFLTPQHHLTHFAFDYWMPLNSMLMAVPMWLFHGDLPTALSVEVVLAAIVALATALISA